MEGNGGTGEEQADSEIQRNGRTQEHRETESNDSKRRDHTRTTMHTHKHDKTCDARKKQERDGRRQTQTMTKTHKNTRHSGNETGRYAKRYTPRAREEGEKTTKRVTAVVTPSCLRLSVLPLLFLPLSLLCLLLPSHCIRSHQKIEQKVPESVPRSPCWTLAAASRVRPTGPEDVRKQPTDVSVSVECARCLLPITCPAACIRAPTNETPPYRPLRGIETCPRSAEEFVEHCERGARCPGRLRGWFFHHASSPTFAMSIWQCPECCLHKGPEMLDQRLPLSKAFDRGQRRRPRMEGLLRRSRCGGSAFVASPNLLVGGMQRLCGLSARVLAKLTKTRRR